MCVNSESRYPIHEIPYMNRTFANLRFIQPVLVEISVELACERKLLCEFLNIHFVA